MRKAVIGATSLAMAGMVWAASEIQEDGLSESATSTSEADAGLIVLPGASASQPASIDSASSALSAPVDGELETAALATLEERVPRVVDSSNQAGWWTPIALSGTTTYVAFNSPPTGGDPTRHEVKVGRRDVNGVWTFGVLRNPDGSTWSYNDDLGHHQPTIAIDGNGYIHVWADMHGQFDSLFPGKPDYGWRYWRSDAPGSLNLIRRGDMPGNGLFTYPVAKRDANGDLWLIIRNRQGSDGTGELYHWKISTASTGSWTKVANFAANADAVVYPDDIAFGTDGSVHLLWEWARTLPRSLRHYGSYLRYAPKSESWSYVDGTPASIPVDLSNPKLFYLPLQQGETFTTDNTLIGLQSAKFALDDNNRPTITYRFRPTNGTGDRDFDIMRIRWNGSAWVNQETIFTASNNTYAALGVTRNADRVRVYFTTTTGGLQQGVRLAGGTTWAINSPAPGRAIQRIGVVSTSSTSDRVYGTAPTDIDANTGSLYLVNVSD